MEMDGILKNLEMKIKFLKQIEILSSTFTITWDKTHDGGAFSCKDSTIIIGIRSYKKDPLYTLQILSHEIMEIILVSMGGRYDNERHSNYLFNFDHLTFENAIQIHTQTINKFYANIK